MSVNSYLPTIILSILIALSFSSVGYGQQSVVSNQNSFNSKNQVKTEVRGEKIAPPGMVFIPGGDFMMGTETDSEARKDESPAHKVRVDGFWMDVNEVTNAQFAEFVKATGFVTEAEKKPDWNELKKQLPPNTPQPPDSILVAGALVFDPPAYAVDLNNIGQWWAWIPGANWRHPIGPGSSISGKENFPVTQVSWDDAVAFCTWAGKRLPTEAEWEFASRGGLQDKKYPWGDDKNYAKHANTWDGHFPDKNTKEDGYELVAPIKSYDPNGYGLYDMGGNVWEWCADWYHMNYYSECAQQPLTINPQGPPKSFDPEEPTIPKRVNRGGSFLCNDSYCSSYRVTARMKTSPDTGLQHCGFRSVMSQQQWEENNRK
jgi:formylglycine-generating enzyme required for sulfatase activity